MCFFSQTFNLFHLYTSVSLVDLYFPLNIFARESPFSRHGQFLEGPRFLQIIHTEGDGSRLA